MNNYVVDAVKPQPGEVPPNVTNDPQIEMQWAVVAMEFAEEFEKRLTRCRNFSQLKLTEMDEEIYVEFRKSFPQIKVAVLDENDIKSDEMKDKWRPFMMQFEKRMEYFNFLTLLRIDCTKEYSQDNTIVVPRIQFYCIELARIREGCYQPNSTLDNDSIITSAKQFKEKGNALFKDGGFEEAKKELRRGSRLVDLCLRVE